MHSLEIIYKKAREKQKTIVFPEGNDKRVISAASEIATLNLAKPILIGEPEKIFSLTKEIEKKLDLNRIEIINHLQAPNREEFIEDFYNLYRNKNKSLNKDEIEAYLNNPLYFGALLVAKGKGEALVAGAVNTTADVFRVAFQIIGPAQETTSVSSYFLMVVPDCSYGEEGVFLFADAAIIPDPSPIQLANIAISTAKNLKALLNYEPRVAMLSFSTKTSATHRLVEKVQKATQIVKEKVPSLIIDGELQVDAAISPEVAAIKAPDSPVKGRANILIFPNLDAGNISYKLIQRLAKAEAYGPVIQGLNKPVSDLSRGCSVKDIISVAAIVAASA